MLTPPIGFFGHAGLFIFASAIVNTVQEKIFSSKDENSSGGGVLDRCPWPFIFFHDPVQGLKDSLTWATTLYLVLWRFLKLYQKAKTVGL
jgi:hypothetical protein